MQKCLKDIVEKYRDKGILVPEDAVEKVEKYCIRKMDVYGIENRNEYLPKLFDNELKNYLIRLSINTASMMKVFGLEVEDYV